MMACVRNKYLEGRIDGRRGQKNSAPLCAEPKSGPARSELIKLIRHRLHEPLGPTLLVLQLLLREESLSPQGVALIRMLQRSIKEEVRAIQELLTIIESFIQEPVQADSRTEQRLEESSQSMKIILMLIVGLMLAGCESTENHVRNRDAVDRNRYLVEHNAVDTICACP